RRGSARSPRFVLPVRRIPGEEDAPPQRLMGRAQGELERVVQAVRDLISEWARGRGDGHPRGFGGGLGTVAAGTGVGRRLFGGLGETGDGVDRRGPAQRRTR